MDGKPDGQPELTKTYSKSSSTSLVPEIGGAGLQGFKGTDLIADRPNVHSLPRSPLARPLFPNVSRKMRLYNIDRAAFFFVLVFFSFALFLFFFVVGVLGATP